MTVHAIVLAAGKGTRMKSETAKVLHRVAGRSLIGWALDAIADIPDVIVVVGHQADAVARELPEHVRSVLQEPQNGTGHAVEVALDAGTFEADDTVLVMPGDMPLIGRETVETLLSAHEETEAAATVLTADVTDPTGYGRIVRDGSRVVAIVEHRDADEATRQIREINTSVYAFDAGALATALHDIGSDNDQRERYLTDVISILANRGSLVSAVDVDEVDAMGVNSHAELAVAAAELRGRMNRSWMEAGVSMIDPARVYVDADVRLEPGVVLYPDVHLEGDTYVRKEAVIGPGVFAVNAMIGAGTRVSYSVLTDVAVGERSVIGPYAHLRPGTELGDGTKAGSFVEVKASSVGDGSKVPHLAYVGDATIGSGTNVGAGSITVNYDGYAKHRTVIGDRARIGSDTMLVAPVEIGDDAYTAAGSVITKNVSPGALGVERSPQREIPGYAARRQRKAEREQS